MKHPKTFQEFDYGHLIARIFISNLRVTATFKGWLPSVAPYISWTFKGLTYDAAKHELVMNNAQQCLQGTYEFVMDMDAVLWMIEKEVTLTKVVFPKDTCHRDALDLVTPFCTKKRPPEAYPYPQEVIDTCAFMFQEFCDYFRLPHIIRLLTICLKHYPQGKQHKVKRRIAAMTTDAMLHTLAANPLDLFLNADKHFQVYLPSYGAFVDMKANMSYKTFETCAARLMDFFRRVYISEHKHTGCTFGQLKHAFLAHEPGAKLVYDQAFWSLVRNKALIYNRDIGSSDDPYVTLPRLHAHAESVCKFLIVLFGNSGEVKRRRGGAPGVPPVLTDEQTRAAWHMRHNPLTIVVGPPGRGKTSMVVWAVAAYHNTAVVSFVGTNVAAHRERMGGHSEVSNTAHHFYYTCKNHDPSWGNAIDVLVWDEFSNVPLNLAAHTLSCVPHVQRALFVLDPAQIAPLKPGHVGVDFIAAFPQHTHTLSVNLRVSSNARALAEAAVHILRGDHESLIEWSDTLEDLASITYIDARHSFERHMYELLQHIYNHVDFYQVYSLKDMQFIAFTREMRDLANEGERPSCATAEEEETNLNTLFFLPVIEKALER